MQEIKQISKQTVETFLGVTLKENTISLGVDVAEHITGLAILRTTDKFVFIDTLETLNVPKGLEVFDAVDLFIDQIENFKKNKIASRYKLSIVVIENCYLAYNPNTFQQLARFGVLVYDRLKALTGKSILIMPTSARAKIKFKKSEKGVKAKELKQEVINYVNKTLDFDNQDTDIADAIVLSLVGLIQEEPKRKKKCLTKKVK